MKNRKERYIKNIKKEFYPKILFLSNKILTGEIAGPEIDR